jgi:hypothetical protein
MSRYTSALLLLLAPQALSAQQIDVAGIYRDAAPSVALVIILDRHGDTLSFGSGFFIDQDGALATNYHVVAGGAQAKVRLQGGEVRAVSGVLAADPDQDLAILEVGGYASDPLTLAGARPMIGEPVVAIGNPMGFEGTVSEGILSGIRSMDDETVRYQVTAPISPGSSGGPILNAAGEVIGIATFIWKEGQNLNFAVPADELGRLWSERGDAQPLDLAAAATGATGLGEFSTNGRRLDVGMESVGELSEFDEQLFDESFAQAWALELPRGESVTVDLLSDQFDAFLIIVGPGIAEPLTDDDGAGACDARISFKASEGGTFTVLANSAWPSEVGTFRLRVTEEPGPMTAGECDSVGPQGSEIDLLGWLLSMPLGGRVIGVGGMAAGELSSADAESWDGSYAQAWALEMQAGEQATVDLRSDDFDSYLFVAGPGLPEPLSDDDGAGGCDSRVTFVAPADGTYRLIVNTLSSGVTGSFVLSVTREPGPVAAAECGGGEDVDVLAELGAMLAELPLVGNLAVGEEVAGALTTDDALSWDGTFVQAWSLKLEAGDFVTVDLVSDDFDAFMVIVAPQLAGVFTDDDGAGACDARVTLTAAVSGQYRVAVNTIEEGATGRFTIRVTEEPSPIAPGECGTLEGMEDLMDELGAAEGQRPDWLASLAAVGSLSLGREVSGALTASDSVDWDGTYVQAWDLELRAGETATVDLRSTDFDAYLMISGPGLNEMLGDDDGAGRCDARITFIAPERGVYKVVVNTLSEGEMGDYRLSVSERPGPVASGSCIDS